MTLWLISIDNNCQSSAESYDLIIIIFNFPMINLSSYGPHSAASHHQTLRHRSEPCSPAGITQTNCCMGSLSIFIIYPLVPWSLQSTRVHMTTAQHKNRSEPRVGKKQHVTPDPGDSAVLLHWWQTSDCWLSEDHPRCCSWSYRPGSVIEPHGGAQLTTSNTPSLLLIMKANTLSRLCFFSLENDRKFTNRHWQVRTPSLW